MILTSPLGIVPRELELTYPAAHYDTAVTGHWDEEEKAWVSSCLEAHLSKYIYKTVVAHVEGAYREICEIVTSKLGIEVIYTAKESLLSMDSLSNLKSVIESFCTAKDFSKKNLSAEEEKKNIINGDCRLISSEKMPDFSFLKKLGNLWSKAVFLNTNSLSGESSLQL